MVITKIEPQKRNDRVNIYIDDEFAFGLMAEIQYKYDLFVGMRVDQEYIDTVLMEEELAKAKDQALGYLGYRQRSEKEIIDKLRGKDFSEDIIENTLVFLREYNFVDDLEFARSFTKDKINLNKFGPQRIRHELYRKGISRDIIDEVLDEDNEYSRALELAKKKLPSYKNDDKAAKYRKLGGFLQRKGYSYECVSRILKELLN